MYAAVRLPATKKWMMDNRGHEVFSVKSKEELPSATAGTVDLQSESATTSALIFQENWLRRNIMGDCPAISAWVDQWSNPVRWILCFLESLVRTFGALIFVNNVWSGILFLTAVLIHNQYTTIIGILGMVVAYFTALLMNMPSSRLRSGVATFNGFMVAQFVAGTAKTFGGTLWNPWIVFPATFFASAR